MTTDYTTDDLQNETQPKRSRTTLWVMIILFGLPYIAAIYFYYFVDRSELGDTSNYGTLISPVRQVEDINLQTLNDSDFKLSDLKGSWILVSIGKSSCAESCQQNLYKMRQIRKAVGEDRSRINRVFLLSDTSEIDSFKTLLPDYQGMHVIKPSNETYQQFITNFSIAGEATEDGIFIIDPLGNYMMAYPKDADAEKILKDVRRLLKVSKIG